MDIKGLINQKQKRAFLIGENPLIDIPTRTVSFPFSSEAPVERFYGMEILNHTPDAVDLSRAQLEALPLLWAHDTNQQIGVVVKVWLDPIEKRLWCTVRFSDSVQGEENFQDVIKGIKRNVSFGYQIEEMIAENEDTYRATKWMIYEISIVSVPADPTVGIGRSLDVEPDEDDKAKKVENQDCNEDENDEKKPVIEVKELQEVKTKKQNVGVKMDENVKNEIKAMGKIYSCEKEAYDFICEEKSLVEFRDFCKSKEQAKNADVPKVELSKKEQKSYSIHKAIRSMLSGKREDAGFEWEVSDAGCRGENLFIPHSAIIAKRAFNMITGAGSNLVATNLISGSFVELLENEMVLSKLGARVMPDLVGNVAIPKQTDKSTAYWIDNGADITAESNPVIGQITMSPKSIGAYIDLGRDLYMQSSVPAESFTINEVLARIGQGVEIAGLKGTGLNKQPKGIYKQTGVGTVTCSATPTFKNMVDMEGAVGAANALKNKPVYVMNAVTAGALKTAEKSSGYPVYIMEKGEINGYPVAISNNLANGEIIFGDFSQVLVGLWGNGIELNIDRSVGSTSGSVRIVAIQSIDIAVRHAGAFATAVYAS